MPAAALALAAVLAAVPVPLPVEDMPHIVIRVDDEQVARWNRFVEQLQALHEKHIAGRKIRTEERLGGYKDLPEFYREVHYYDAETGRLLSRLSWERKNPDRLHVIEVFIYDDSGRLVRDYAASFLPVHRNAPIQTLINLHHHGDGVHAYRQFDASGNWIYEQCRARDPARTLLLSLEEDDIIQARQGLTPVMSSEEYRRCFGPLPETAGIYLTPQ